MPNLSTSRSVSDKTYSPSNKEFLEVIFRNVKGEEKPILVGFRENPNSKNNSKWLGKAWLSDTDIPTEEENSYFSISNFKQSDNRVYRRKKELFAGLYAIVLDDIGDKEKTNVSINSLALKASWILETSENNFQAGYLLSFPIKDVTQADKLMQAIIAKGLCDKGAGGPTARVMRLPEGINGKYDPAFQCKMHAWNPELRYTVDELVAEFELDLGLSKASNKKSEENINKTVDEIFIPAPIDNPVIVALKQQQLYKSKLDSSKHDITCPWCEEHTDEVDGGTGYFEPSSNFPVGGFKCFHGHCSHRKIKDLLECLGVDRSIARMKDTIRCQSGEIHRIIIQAEKILAQSGQYYQSSGVIVTVGRDPSDNETYIKALSQSSLLGTLSALADWENWDGRCKDWKRIDPPARAITAVHDSIEYRYLPILNGLAHQPYFNKKNILINKSGYDNSTKLYGVFTSQNFNVIKNPTRVDALQALNSIKELLVDFPFVDKSDESAALAAILTATVRPALENAPMFHVRAPQIGAGKSFLCSIISCFASEKCSSPTNFPKDDEECHKVLIAELQRFPAVIEFDNLTSDLVPHKSLCMALTSERIMGRILGVSKTINVSTRVLFLSSGNNVSPVKDMVRRCITINLNPNCEISVGRTFKRPNLLEEVNKQRSELVSFALVVINAWLAAGSPKTDCKHVAGFGKWSDLCRQPLLWLEQVDPTESMFKAMYEDPEREMLGSLLALWHREFGSSPNMVREFVKIITDKISEDESEYELLLDIAGHKGSVDKKRLGHWVKNNANRVVDGFRFSKVLGTYSAAKWRVMKDK